VDADMVTAGLFPALGVAPALGRGILPDDERPGAARVGIISDRFWNRAYRRSPDGLGDTILLNGVPVTVVGVAPPSFEGLEIGRSPDIWIQMGPSAGLTPWGTPSKGAPEVVYAAADYWWLPVVARLKDGVTVEQARTELERLFHESLRAAAGSAVPADKLPPVSLAPAARGLNAASRRLSTPLTVLMIVAGLVLLVACANVATLLLARATSRRREMAVRLALGAPRWRLVRQLMTESLLYAVSGAVVGTLVAAWGGRLLLVLLQQGRRDPIPLRVGIDVTVLGFAALAALVTTVLFGLAPALRATRLDLGSDLKENSPTVRASRFGRLRGGQALVAAQVALSLPLVLGAALFLRTLDNLERQPLGFDPSRLLLFRLDATKGGFTGDRLLAAYGEIRERVAALPGVQSVTASRLGLMTGWISNGPITVENQEALDLDRRARTVHWNMVAPGFFDTMAMQLKLGRPIDDRDRADGPRVAVVNEALARRFFPRQNPLGRRFWFGRTREGDGVEIVGVAADAKYSTLRDPAPPTAFLPYTQDRYPLSAVFFEVRADGDHAALVAGITGIVRRVVPGVPLDQVKTQSQQIADSLGQETMFARLFTLFGLLALVLASVGLYATMSFALARRTREIGIRMALGAAGRRVLRASLLEAAGVAGAGIGAGMLLAWAGSRYVRSLLFGVTPLDGPTVVVAVGVMVAVTLAAAYIPARRAARLDPLRALREE
jgi:predicted permease